MNSTNRRSIICGAGPLNEGNGLNLEPGGEPLGRRRSAFNVKGLIAIDSDGRIQRICLQREGLNRRQLRRPNPTALPSTEGLNRRRRRRPQSMCLPSEFGLDGPSNDGSKSMGWPSEFGL